MLKLSVYSLANWLQQMHPDIPSLILDVFNVMDSETCNLDSQSIERLNLAYMVKQTEKVCILNCSFNRTYYYFIYKFLLLDVFGSFVKRKAGNRHVARNESSQ